MGFSIKSPYPAVEDIGYPGVGIKNIRGYPGGAPIYLRISRGVRKNLQITRGVDYSKRDILNRVRAFSGIAQFNTQYSYWNTHILNLGPYSYKRNTWITRMDIDEVYTQTFHSLTHPQEETNIVDNTFNNFLLFILDVDQILSEIITIFTDRFVLIK